MLQLIALAPTILKNSRQATDRDTPASGTPKNDSLIFDNHSKRPFYMRLILLYFLLFASVAAAAQHQHETHSKKATADTSKPKDKAKADSLKKVPIPKDSTKRNANQQPKAKTHTHRLDDSTIIVHDEKHNEIKDTTKKLTHTHQLGDSTIVVHDEHHNQVSDTGLRHRQGANTTHHYHDMGTSSMHSDHVGHSMAHEGQHQSSAMSHAFSRNLPMNRNGSGTGWLPDASPMFGYMFHPGKWMYMLHGNIFLRYNKQDLSGKGSRGDEQFDAPNWVMLMGQRQVGRKGLFHFSTMLSLDAVVAGGKGYPLLFQSGELYEGSPLVDRQHPHDLFSELSVSYAHSINKDIDVFAYLGYPGEPALGPVAFMHRASALANPDAPLSHHWVDATHVTFGVATVGIRFGKFKVEGSSFTGREPDENRYDFDKPRFDSWSGRVSFNPTANWALQASHAFIESPETLHADKDINRTTASAIYSRTTRNGWISATALWGMNKAKGHDGEHAILAEASWNHRKFTLHSRFEHVQKSVEELVLDETLFGHDAVFPVNALTLGLNYDLFNLGKTRIAAGGQFTWYSADKRLDVLYGNNPMAAQVYLRIYPTLMTPGR